MRTQILWILLMLGAGWMPVLQAAPEVKAKAPAISKEVLELVDDDKDVGITLESAAGDEIVLGAEGEAGKPAGKR